MDRLRTSPTHTPTMKFQFLFTVAVCSFVAGAWGDPAIQTINGNMVVVVDEGQTL